MQFLSRTRSLPPAALAALALAVALAASGCGSSKSSMPKKVVPGKPIEEVSIKETEFKLDPAKVELGRAGIYRFHAINAGTKVHALRITGPGVSAVTARLKPGQSTTVDVIARKKGTYTYFDPLAGHRKKGMVGLALLG
jgi:uncharacterized cupredoxin-like copper-binding protein